jgi:hypothetical protein
VAFHSATLLERIENYLRSGNSYAYVQVALPPGGSPGAA